MKITNIHVIYTVYILSQKEKLFSQFSESFEPISILTKY